MIADDVVRQYDASRKGYDLDLVHAVANSAIAAYKARSEKVAKHHEGCKCDWCAELYPWIMTEHWHGSIYGYSRYKCRCVKCKLAQQNYSRERKG